jgi:hypothetical protein
VRYTTINGQGCGAVNIAGHASVPLGPPIARSATTALRADGVGSYRYSMRTEYIPAGAEMFDRRFERIRAMVERSSKRSTLADSPATTSRICNAR